MGLTLGGGAPPYIWPWSGWYTGIWWMWNMFGILFLIWLSRNICDIVEISANLGNSWKFLATGGFGHIQYNNNQMDQYQVEYRFGTIYPSIMFQYTFSSYNRIQIHLAVILSMLARTFASQKRKAKPVKNRPKLRKFGPYFEKCRFWLQKGVKIEIWFYILILQVILNI